MRTDGQPFYAYAVGLVAASVCTSLSLEEATERLNSEHPTGISSHWQPSKDERFHTGQPNPCPCQQNPDTHKHYLFNC